MPSENINFPCSLALLSFPLNAASRVSYYACINLFNIYLFSQSSAFPAALLSLISVPDCCSPLQVVAFPGQRSVGWGDAECRAVTVRARGAVGCVPEGQNTQCYTTVVRILASISEFSFGDCSSKIKLQSLEKSYNKEWWSEKSTCQ